MADGRPAARQLRRVRRASGERSAPTKAGGKQFAMQTFEPAMSN